MSDVSKHTFNKGVDTILKECLAVSDQRGGEYEDTWDLKNIRTVATDIVLKLADFDHANPELYIRWRRLLIMGALIDVKLSRMMGPFKEDTIIDLINYSACFAYLKRDWDVADLEASNPKPTTFNDNVTADLHASKPEASFHYHVNHNIVIPVGEQNGYIVAGSHTLYDHRQDGSPILAHRPEHEGTPQERAKAANRRLRSSYVDSEYGPA